MTLGTPDSAARMVEKEEEEQEGLCQCTGGPAIGCQPMAAPPTPVRQCRHDRLGRGLESLLCDSGLSYIRFRPLSTNQAQTDHNTNTTRTQHEHKTSTNQSTKQAQTTHETPSESSRTHQYPSRYYNFPAGGGSSMAETLYRTIRCPKVNSFTACHI